jgi:hypothetical protein
VLVPTRGRPDNIVALMKSWEATSSGIADLILSVDWDDPKRNEYPESIDLPSWAKVHYGPRRRLGGTLNKLAPAVADLYDVVGFMGDDHRPRTEDWDGQIYQHASAGRVVYGDDLVQGPNLPTAVFLDSRIVKTLGHFVLPGQIHLWMDNYWKTLGEQLGALRYLPEVVIEHVHPITGAVPWDEGYIDANTSSNWENDERIYKEWIATQMPADIKALKAALA